MQTLHHNFRLVNTFTLRLCLLCQKPLCGSHMQCATCYWFAHSACLSTGHLQTCGSARSDSTCVSISSSTLIQSCCEFYKDLFALTEQDILQRCIDHLLIFANAATDRKQWYWIHRIRQHQLFTFHCLRGTSVSAPSSAFLVRTLPFLQNITHLSGHVRIP